MGLLVVAPILISCGNVLDTKYRTLEEAIADGAQDRGWIPLMTPKTAVDIHEAHDLDTNRSMLFAKYDSKETIKPDADCEGISVSEAEKPPFKKKWWAGDVPTKYSTPRVGYMKCGEEIYAAWGQGEFYYWRR